jgi:hypothetical protein
MVNEYLFLLTKWEKFMLQMIYIGIILMHLTITKKYNIGIYLYS